MPLGRERQTPSEAEVIALITQGLSNRDIADRVFSASAR
jgi:DNA-binding NarL/FixJ family response regulator